MMTKNKTEKITPPDWLHSINLQQLTGILANFNIEKILRHKYRYIQPPVLTTGQKIIAILESDYFQPRPRFGNRAGSAPYTVTLKKSSKKNSRSSSLDIEAHCTSGEEPYSAPAQALLIDIAVYPALREALIHQQDTHPLLEELPAIREQTYRDYVAHHALSLWAPKEQLKVAASPEYALSIYDTATTHLNYYDTLSEFKSKSPYIEIRPRLPGKKPILAENDIKEMRFPPTDAQLLGSCQALHSRKGFFVKGSTAAEVLHLLEENRVVKREEDNQPIYFAKTPVFLKMVATRLPRKRIGKRNTSRVPQEDYEQTLHTKTQKTTDPTLETIVNALEAHWYTRDATLEISSADAVLVAGLYSYLWVEEKKTFYPVSPLVDMEAALRLCIVPSIHLVEGHAPLLYRELRHQFQGTMIALPPPVEMGLSPAEKPEFKLRIIGEPLQVELYLEAHYSFGIFPLFPGPSLGEFAGTRDVDLEDAAVEHIMRLNFQTNAQKNCFMSGSEEQAACFWLEGIELLKQAEPKMALMIPAKLQETRVRKKLKARLKVSLVSGWFDTEVLVSTEDFDDINLAQLQTAIENKKRWVTLNDGSLAELTDELRDLLQDGLDVLSPSGKGRLAVYQLGRLNNWKLSPEVSVEIDQEVEQIQTRSALFTHLAHTGETSIPLYPKLPKKLNATLRPYQLQGIAWLQFLHELSAGGILADDMGLGKTLMALTLLSWRKEKEGTMPNLIICPTSVMSNWLKEANRFTPTLKTVLLTGEAREYLRACIKTDKTGQSQFLKTRFKRSPLGDVDIMVTSYGLLRRDVELLAQIPCRYLILDEAQNIKNYETATAKAARRLQGESRLALSGTPVENRLGELYSLMDFCNPGMLGSKKDFLRRFEMPILSDSRGPAAHRLREMIRPFVLRRTKRQVLQDLPPKQEIEHLCLLSLEQKQRYDALAMIVRGEIAPLFANAQSLGQNQIKLLTALLRLRQMACDPRLIDRSLPARQSVKRNEFMTLVRELVSEGRRVLVFSQFVELLHLWKRDIEREGIAYEYLDGSTKNREEVIEGFQNGDAPLFLISLKAGGTGLNLTAADTVIHCDPWWNPAVEEQATDRAHRIGQTKPVTVYRLIAAGTIEEKIIQLKTRKRELAEAIMTDDSAALRGLTVEDVELLLEEASVAEFEHESETGVEIPSEEPFPLAASTPMATSILEKTTGEALLELGKMMRAWLEKEGKKQKQLATALNISSYTVSQLLRGKKKSMPTLEYQRVKALLESFATK
jgi:SNF2 family DNA or RNA helicase